MAEPAGRHRPEHSPAHGRVLIALSVAMVGAMTTWFSMTAVLPELTGLWGLTPATAGTVTIAVQAGFVVGSLIAAFTNLPDRVAPPRLFFASALAAGLVTLATALFVRGLAPALALRFITGAALAGVYGPGLKLMATWFRLRRGMALGTVVGALTLGSAAPHLFRGLGAPSWQAVLAIAGLLAMAAGALVLLAVPVGPYPLPAGRFEPGAIPRLLRHPPVRLTNFGYFGHMWELYAMWAWFGAFAAASLGARSGDTAPVAASVLTFAVIAAGAAGSWVAGTLADRFGRPRLTLWSLGVSGAMALTIGFAFSGPPFLVGLLGIIWGFSVVADSAQFSALVTEHADQQFVGTAVTFQLAVGFALTIPVIWLLPMAQSVAGWRFAFWLLLPGPLLGAAAMARLRRLTRSAGSFTP